MYAVEHTGYDGESVARALEKETLSHRISTDTDPVTGHERFVESGFRVVYEQKHHTHILSADGSYPGSLAHKYGVAVAMMHTAFALEKRD